MLFRSLSFWNSMEINGKFLPFLVPPPPRIFKYCTCSVHRFLRICQGQCTVFLYKDLKQVCYDLSTNRRYSKGQICKKHENNESHESCFLRTSTLLSWITLTRESFFAWNEFVMFLLISPRITSFKKLFRKEYLCNFIFYKHQKELFICMYKFLFKIFFTIIYKYLISVNIQCYLVLTYWAFINYTFCFVCFN